MKLCKTCVYGTEYELDKPCIVYRADCQLYQKEGDGMTKLTNRQAIGVLDGLWSNPLFGDSHRQAFEIGIKAIKALEQEPCNDAISRQAVLDVLEKEGHKWGNDYRDWVDAIEEIKKLPPVNPQEPKTGHWEWVQYDYNPKIGNWHCSECRCIVVECVGKKEKGGIPLYKYCPQCGAKMVEPQESDHKCHNCKHYMNGEQDGSCDSYICEHYSNWESEDKG